MRSSSAKANDCESSASRRRSPTCSSTMASTASSRSSRWARRDWPLRRSTARRAAAVLCLAASGTRGDVPPLETPLGKRLSNAVAQIVNGGRIVDVILVVFGEHLGEPTRELHPCLVGVAAHGFQSFQVCPLRAQTPGDAFVEVSRIIGG